MICENEVGFSAALQNLKVPAAKKVPESGKVGGAQNNINVLVWSCLHAKQRIDGPTAIEPHLNPGALEQLQEINQSLESHLGVHVSIRLHRIRSNRARR